MTTATKLQVEPITVPGQQTYNGKPFPYIYGCKTPGVKADQAAEWASAHAKQLVSEATEYGTVLFRGFDLATPQDFDTFISGFGLENFPYDDSLSNAVRVNKTPRVFTANEAPPNVSIFLHHEMAQTPIYPNMLFFFCEHAAETGGATPLCRSDVLWDKLAKEQPQFAKDCEQKGLKYTNVMPAEADQASGMGRSWKSTLKAETKEQAEQKLKDLGYAHEWTSDGSLRATTPVLPAVFKMADGRRTFFNQLIAASKGWKDSRNDPSKAITFGDGQPLNRQAVDRAVELGEELSFNVPWQRGDVAFVDNRVVMHGRRTFTGTRKVLASLADQGSSKNYVPGR